MATMVHGTCIEFGGVGVLLLGPSGSGKSDLALRLIDQGAVLVADDQVSIECASDRLIAHAPSKLVGILEVRGIGLVNFPVAPPTPVSTAIELVRDSNMERLPDAQFWECLGIRVPRYQVDPFTASACAKVRLVARGVRHALQTS